MQRDSHQLTSLLPFSNSKSAWFNLSFLTKTLMCITHNHYNFQHLSPAGHVKGMQEKLTHFSRTSVKWLCDLSLILSRNMLPFLMLTFSSLFLERKRGEKAPFYVCHSNIAKNLLKHTSNLLQTLIFRYNSVVHCNALSPLHCITDISIHQWHLITQDDP